MRNLCTFIVAAHCRGSFVSFRQTERFKFEKLEGVVRKIYSQLGVIKEIGLWMPVEEETGKTRGYCFIEYNTPQKFMRVPDEWAAPESKPHTSGGNLQHWLTDEKGGDHFVIRAGSDTEVLWNDARQVKADPVYKRLFWTERFVQCGGRFWNRGMQLSKINARIMRNVTGMSNWKQS
ncbi:hypothetical protein L1887_24118 [Cichorium endivia]|nr:hypothetical protein L1887_24118 [Cichorium endivia]